MALDVLTLNVLINSFHEIAEEMGVNLLHSARSTIIREARDCSCALLDARGRIIAEAEHIPVQMSSLSLPIKACLRKFRGRIGPDELFVTNDPYIGGQHLQDITIFTPVFAGRRLVAFTGSIAHHVDIGGGAPGLTFDAKEFYQEGLRFTAVKYHRRDFETNGTFHDLVHSNFRAPEVTWGDLQAQLAANDVGRRRLGELVTRYGMATLQRYMDAAMAYSERMMRAAIARMPAGRYEAEDRIDDGVFRKEPIPIRVALEVRGDGITADFTGSAPQVDEFLNVPIGSTYSSTYSCVKMVLTSGQDPIPANDGCYRPITVHAPAGSIVNPSPPAAVRARMCGAYRVFDALLKAFQQAIPERVIALGFHANTTSGLSRFADGKFSIFIEDIGGGWGGNPRGDGADMLDAPLSNCLITPIEAVELDHPFALVRRYELLPDTGGPGRHRGGLGSVREYEVLEGGAEFFGYADRHRFRPDGTAGGQPGTTGRFSVLREDQEIVLPSKIRFPLRKGDVVRVVAGGGGGFGPPEDRPPDAVLEDLQDGKITPAHARQHYPQIRDRLPADTALERDRDRS